MRNLIFYLVFLFFFQNAFAFNYYVSPSGNDEDNGSVNSPFASLERACDELMAGDTVFMRGGIYNSQQLINAMNDGTESEPIVFMNFPGEEPIIDGSGVSLSNNSALLYIANWWGNLEMEHLVVDGITVRNSSQRGISFYKTDYLEIRNCIVYNIQKRAIGGYGHYVKIDGNEIYNAVMENENSTASSGWPFCVYATTDYETGDPSEYIEFTNNIVHDCWGEGIGPGQGTNHVLIEGNTIYDVWSVGIYCDKGTNVTISKNHVYFENPEYYRFGEPSLGISIANEIAFGSTYQHVNNIKVHNNFVYNARKGVAFWFDDSNSESENTYANVNISYNTIVNPTTAGIYFDEIPGGNLQPANCVLKNNIIFRGSMDAFIGNPEAWDVSNNNWYGGIPAFAGDNAMNADPMFIDESDPSLPVNFKLQEGSPCIGSAINLTTVSDDFWYVARTNTPTIGFHEFNDFSSIDLCETNNKQLSVYPNPCSDIITVDGLNEHYEYKIFNTLGMLVKQGKNTRDNLNVSNLKAGLYSLFVKGNNTTDYTQLTFLKN